MNAIKKKFPILDEKGRPSTYPTFASQVYRADGTPVERDGIIHGAALDVYPVGSIFLSVNQTSPAAMFGGTWERLKDRFLLGAGDGYAAGGTGGASTVGFTPSGSNEWVAITAAQMPAHAHTMSLWNDAGTKGNAKSAGGYGEYFVDTTYGLKGTWGSWQTGTFQVAGDGYGDRCGVTELSGGNHSHSHAFYGTYQTIDNMPPYLAVYMWKRVS